jgi:tetratricopeptide (TPR) repeat protein
VPHYERALALVEASRGKSHPDVALLLSALGACYDHAGDSAKALAAFQRALAIREAVFGPTSPRLVATLNNLADFQRHTGDIAGAQPTIDRALAIAEKAPGPKHPLYHLVVTTRAEILVAAGKLADGEAALDALIPIEEDAKSPILGTTLASRAEMAIMDKSWAQAIGLEERAIGLMEAAGGKDAPELWKPLAGLARATTALGDAAAAKVIAQRAVAIGRAAKVSDADLASAVALAR